MVGSEGVSLNVTPAPFSTSFLARSFDHDACVSERSVTVLPWVAGGESAGMVS